MPEYSPLVNLDTINHVYNIIKSQIGEKVYTTTANSDESLGTSSLPYKQSYLTNINSSSSNWSIINGAFTSASAVIKGSLTSNTLKVSDDITINGSNTFHSSSTFESTVKVSGVTTLSETIINNTLTLSSLDASRVAVLNENKQLVSSSYITTAELNQLDGITTTETIQSQFNNIRAKYALDGDISGKINIASATDASSSTDTNASIHTEGGLAVEKSIRANNIYAAGKLNGILESSGAQTCVSGTTALGFTGFRIAEIYNNSWPFTYGNAIQFRGKDHIGANELALEWTGGETGTTGGIAYRSKRDTSATAWGPWKYVPLSLSKTTLNLDNTTDASSSTDTAAAIHTKGGLAVEKTIRSNSVVTNTFTISNTVTISEGAQIKGTMASNDSWWIKGGGSDDAGYLEIGTADNGYESIYIRQFTSNNTLAREAIILDGSGNTTFPGHVYGAYVHNAVGNDIIDCIDVSSSTELEYGYCYSFNDGEYKKTDRYMDKGYIGIHSDTSGMSIGEKKSKQLKISVAGFVLAHVDKGYKSGTPLTCTKDGKLTKIRLLDRIFHPYMIVAKYWKKEDSDVWKIGEQEVEVNNRSWVKLL